MRTLLLVLLLLAIAWFTADLADQAVDHESVHVKTVQQWGRIAPPYVIESSMFTTTTQPRARTAPRMRAASAGPVVLEENVNGYPCGPSQALPPCSVMRRESGGNPNAYNTRGCNGHGCYGLWQFSGEWACHFGLSCDIAHWTVDEQNHAARTLWDNGRGCSHWASCG